ncbi:MAG TPA: PEP-CTERM sorting domain-containing protein [Pyrinomonadaceae bacterium]|nr:PEP-CTERM sorting domain-containing protein [Pyrinomonadaceae bacterium]
MNKLVVSLAVLFVLCLSSAAKADTLTFTPNPVDLNDLDHHNVYTWRIDTAHVPTGQQITGARITISQIANWDTNANRLFIHLLDTAKNAGVASFQDEPANAVPVNHIDDDFVDTRYHNDPNWLVANGTADTFLTSSSFTMTPTNFVYNFTAAQVNALISYLSNDGKFALGFDPDCHFFNNGISLQIFTAPAQTTPEPATLALLGTGLAGLYARKRRQQKAAREV